MDTLSEAQQEDSPIRAGHYFSARAEDRHDTSISHHSRFISLQPIFNLDGGVFGYEALSRSSRSNRFAGDSRHATHRIISDWLLDGLDSLTADKPVFLNCTREDLTGDLTALLPLPIVIEVLESVQVDEWVIDACRRVKAFGHGIAVDGFELYGVHDDLLDLADYVKVDFQLWGELQRQEILAQLRGTRVRLIAEKIETRDELQAALDEGFDLLQGYYLARPVLLSKGGSRRRWINHLRLRWHSRSRRGRWR